MKMKHRNIAILLSIALVAVGCKQQETVNRAPVKVKTMKVAQVNENCSRHYSGTIEEESGSALSFSVAGTVEQLNVTAGQWIGEGQLIATVDETTLQNAYAASAAALEQAQDAYARLKQLHDNNSLPEMQWVEAQSKLKQAQSAEQISKKNLADSKLYAPFSGVIAEKEVELGQNVMPGVPVVKLVTIDNVKVCISVPENEISRITLGQNADITVAALGGKQFEGKIIEKNVSANRLSRSYEVKAIVKNPSHELMPGMICDLTITPADYTAQVIVLSCNIVQLDNANHSFVWVNDGGKAAKRLISTGTLTADGIIVTAGLAVGDEVIVEGQQKVSEMMDIQVEQ